MALLKISSVINKILKCDFHFTKTDELSEVIVINARTSDQPTIREDVQVNLSTNAGPAGSHRGLSGNRDLICFENERRNLQRPLKPVVFKSNEVPSRDSHTQSNEIFYRDRQRQVASDQLSRTFKEYVQRQLDNLSEETLSFNGTANSSEFKRLHIRMDRELELLEMMDINDKTLQGKWKLQVIGLQKILTHNTKKRDENLAIQNRIPALKIKTIIPTNYQPVPVHHNTTKVAIQKQEDDINNRKRKVQVEFNAIHQILTLLSKEVFIFCEYTKNVQYYYLESNINTQLKSLKSIEIKGLPEFSLRKFEIEQFGNTWLRELHRRIEEMIIRKYEARIKALW